MKPIRTVQSLTTMKLLMTIKSLPPEDCKTTLNKSFFYLPNLLPIEFIIIYFLIYFISNYKYLYYEISKDVNICTALHISTDYILSILSISFTLNWTVRADTIPSLYIGKVQKDSRPIVIGTVHTMHCTVNRICLMCFRRCDLEIV